MIFHSAWKIACATLLTLALVRPGFAALAAAFDRRWSFRETLCLALAAGARSSLVLFALSPVLWLAIDLGAAYYSVQLLATAGYGLAGLSGLGFWLRALGPAAGRFALSSSFVSAVLARGSASRLDPAPFPRRSARHRKSRCSRRGVAKAAFSVRCSIRAALSDGAGESVRPRRCVRRDRARMCRARVAPHLEAPDTGAATFQPRVRRFDRDSLAALGAVCAFAAAGKAPPGAAEYLARSMSGRPSGARRDHRISARERAREVGLFRMDPFAPRPRASSSST